MKYCRWIFLVCLCVTTVSQAQSKPAVKEQILSLLKEQMVAANAHDTDRFLATYLRNPELVFIANGKMIRGWDQLRDQQLKWWRNGKSDVVYAAEAPPEIASLDSQTVLVTEEMTSHRTSPDGNPSNGSFIITTIWRKLPAGWRVIYGHESWVR